MKHLLLSIFISIAWNGIYANDGAYYMNGNQLIPINENTISVQKEILTISHTNSNVIEVDVYYEFYNPGPAKTVLVGFEASSPSGDAENRSVGGEHPNMYGFNVIMNDQPLDYEVSFVMDEEVRDKSQLSNQSFRDFAKGRSLDPTAGEGFLFVYHFKAPFKKGKNIIHHTYLYDASEQVASRYVFGYVLTAANRWANQQIDDFTLILDMGDFEEFALEKSFFNSASEWEVQGRHKFEDSENWLSCYVEKGPLFFKKKNFHPKGEIFIHSYETYPPQHYQNQLPYAYKTYYLSEDGYTTFDFSHLSNKILRNLPFARRGYVFESQELKDFYEQQVWYMPNPNYEASFEDFDYEEHLWYAKYARPQKISNNYVTGDFTGDGNQDYVYLVQTQESTGNEESDVQDEYEIRIMGETTALKAYCCDHILINEGDLDGDGKDELSIMEMPLGCTGEFTTYKLNYIWEEIVPTFLVPTACEDIPYEDWEDKVFLKNGDIYYLDIDPDTFKNKAIKVSKTN